ncbi:hypothetical protein KAH55_13620 [bacterium]|nr:hypothetical protein [bacterium]
MILAVLCSFFGFSLAALGWMLYQEYRKKQERERKKIFSSQELPILWTSVSDDV